MANYDHQIFEDVPAKGKNKYHSAILTTFSIDLINFDSKELRTLHKKQITSVNILADLKQLNKAMDIASIDYLYNIGQMYAVNGIHSAGAFHPKINFFVGYDCAMVILGSGNLTVPGHGKNHELFTGFMIDSELRGEGGIYMLIQECWQYIKRFANKCGKYTAHRICEELPHYCSVLERDVFLNEENYHALYDIGGNLSAALLYNDDSSSILSQAFSHIPLDEVKEITILSPFFDENGETIITIANLCNRAKVSVLLQRNCSLPPNRIHNHPRIKFYDFDTTDRGQKKSLSGNKEYRRRLHAKLIHFKTDKEEFCIVGSANATISGLGTLEKRGLNEEFCVLYSSATIKFLKEIGISKKLSSINIASLSRHPDSFGLDSNLQVRLTNAEYSHKRLSISYEGIKSEDQYRLVVSQSNADEIEIQSVFDNSGYRVLDITLNEKPCSCALYDSNGFQISNILIINKTDSLDVTNPSKNNRATNQLISLIENEGYNGLEISDLISDLIKDISSLTNTTEITHSSAYNTIQTKRTDLPDIKYNEYYDMELDNEYNKDLDSFNHSGSASRLIDCIEDSIARVISNLEESQKGEEELGSAETSHNRSYELKPGDAISRKVLDSLPQKVDSLLASYNKLCDVRYLNLLNSDNVLGKEDFNFFSLTMFVALELSFLNQESYKDKESENESLSQGTTELFDKLLRCMVQPGLESLCKFTKLCLLEKYPEDADEVYMDKIERAVRYAILYAVLILKRYGTEEIIKFKGPKIDLCIMNLFDYFSSPDNETIIEELSPIAERYNYEFRVEDIINYVNEIEEKKESGNYFYKQNYGWCYKNGKSTLWIS